MNVNSFMPSSEQPFSEKIRSMLPVNFYLFVQQTEVEAKQKVTPNKVTSDFYQTTEHKILMFYKPISNIL